MGHLSLLLLVFAPMFLFSHAGTVQKTYKLNLLSNGKDYVERISVDTRKNTQTSQVQEVSSGKNYGDTIYDFQRKLKMIREPENQVCFLSKSTGENDVPPLADLIRVYNMLSRADVKITPGTVEDFKIVGKPLQDRSGLSKEMADLCANLPIYRVVRSKLHQNDSEQMSDEEAADVPEIPGVGSGKRRRGICRNVCRTVCSVSCSWSGCSRSCKNDCNVIC